jgi:hypothetical protein
MAGITIKHPTRHNTNDNKKGLPRRFIAAGTASINDPQIIGVLGKLDAPFTKPGGIPGKTMMWTIRRNDNNYHHWAILFGSPDDYIPPGRHHLYVRGFLTNGDYCDADVEFDRIADFIETTYPANNADISGDVDYFVAYGELSHDALSAVMDDSEAAGTDFRSDSMYSNPLINFWSAVFPPLVEEREYVLHVVDSMFHTATPIKLYT